MLKFLLFAVQLSCLCKVGSAQSKSQHILVLLVSSHLVDVTRPSGLIHYGKVSVPATLTSVSSDSGRQSYLVLNIEFDRTYYLLGFEFYSVNPGTVQTAVIEHVNTLTILAKSRSVPCTAALPGVAVHVAYHVQLRSRA